MIELLGSMEGKWIFNNLNFIKLRIYNLLTKHLALCVRMFGQSFLTMQNFSYGEIVGIYQLAKHEYALNV